MHLRDVGEVATSATTARRPCYTAGMLLRTLARRFAHAARRTWRAFIHYLDRMPGPLVTWAWIAVGWIGTTVALACGPLTPAAATAIEAADAAACPLLALIPAVGPALAAACPGEEALVKAALDHAVASADAGAPVGTASAAMVAAPSVPSHVALTHKRRGRRRHVGYAPASLAPVAQAYLDGRAEP